MARFEFNMPDVGEGLAEVEVAEWKVSVGDRVEENREIADIETDKSLVSMPAPATGRITHLAAQAGDRVKVGALLLVMEVSDEATAESKSEPATVASAEGPGAAVGAKATTAGRLVAATPSARRLACELGVDLTKVHGSGPRGRIVPDDVEAHAGATAAPEAPAAVDSAPHRAVAGVARPEAANLVQSGTAAGAEVEEVPLRGIRHRVAENLTKSYREIPHVAGFHEFVVPRLVAERERLRPQAEARGLNLTYLALVVRAVALGLREHPWLNAELDDERGVVLLKKTYHIGIAMATPEGLVVPVVKSADQHDVWGIAAELARLGAAASERRMLPEGMRGGTFTVSNVGPAGGNYGMSLICPPEVAILGLGRIHDRAVVEEGRVVARPVLPVSLTFDHRVVDGEQALAFVATLRQYLEHDPGVLTR